MGGDLGGLRDGPSKFEAEDGPCIRHPNIWRSSVTGCVSKYELSKKRCHEGSFLWNRGVFRQERGLICYILDFRQQREAKTNKIRSITKKRRWNEFFFLKKAILKFLSAKLFSVAPTTRRQVSAYGIWQGFGLLKLDAIFWRGSQFIRCCRRSLRCHQRPIKSSCHSIGSIHVKGL